MKALKMKLGTKIAVLVLALSLAPILIVTAFNVNSSKTELGKVVTQDFSNLTIFLRELLRTHDELATEARIGEEIVWILQARQQEKNFIIREDKESIDKWHAVMENLKRSEVHVGDVPAALKHYEEVFDKFTKGMLADLNELARSGQALEAVVAKTAQEVKLAYYQDSIREEILGPRLADGTRDLSKGIRIGQSGYVFFFKPDGTLLGHPTLEGRKIANQDLLKRAVETRDGYFSYTEDGKAKIAFYRYFEPWDWFVAVDAFDDEVLNVSGIKRAGGIVALAFAILVPIVTFLFVRTLTRPINAIANGLSEVARHVALASEQVSSSSQSLAEGASQQAASLEETSSALEEMASMTKHNAENATQADRLMHATNRVVSEANTSMEDLTESIREISLASEETSKIIKTIDEIAFQTNLLALNAAVEAARAGEAGAGFAVVADEVRNLAMRSAEAAKNTANLIEGTVKKVKNGDALVARTNEAFRGVAENSSKVGELVGEIAAASNEQSQGIDQINRAVAEMDKVIQQTAAHAEESAGASEELSGGAIQMEGIVKRLVDLVGIKATRRNGTDKKGHGRAGGREGQIQTLADSTSVARMKDRKSGSPPAVASKAGQPGKRQLPEPVNPGNEF